MINTTNFAQELREIARKAREEKDARVAALAKKIYTERKHSLIKAAEKGENGVRLTILDISDEVMRKLIALWRNDGFTCNLDVHRRDIVQIGWGE